MGRLDQYAKEIFASETPVVTRGGAFFHAPIELSLTDVRLDGHLVITDRALLADLPAPWCHAHHHEIVLEIKMQGDHLDERAIARALLRRQAREVQLLEAPDSPWEGELPIWLVTSHLPPALRERRRVHALAPGCHRIGPATFPFLWIAANELPLRDELLPFLIARTGKALDELGRWVAQHQKKDPLWLARMVEYLPMSTAVYDELIRFALLPNTEPDIVERKKILGKIVLDMTPELKAEVVAEGRDEGRLTEARSALRRVLAHRKLTLLAEQEARIDACSDLLTLERWLEQAVDAPNTANALR